MSCWLAHLEVSLHIFLWLFSRAKNSQISCTLLGLKPEKSQINDPHMETYRLLI